MASSGSEKEPPSNDGSTTSIINLTSVNSSPGSRDLLASCANGEFELVL
jgi:hypothetical protein